MKTKHCGNCGTTDDTAFASRSFYQCRSCHAEYERQWCKRNPDKHRAQSRTFARKHPENNAQNAKVWRQRHIDEWHRRRNHYHETHIGDDHLRNKAYDLTKGQVHPCIVSGCSNHTERHLPDDWAKDYDVSRIIWICRQHNRIRVRQYP